MPKNVFIIRPFGKKQGIDFDKIDKKLIQPALKRAGLEGIAAQRIFKPGDIRVDLFEELLTADVVIADVSIHSANVFYELGVRHAFRKKHTVLIRCDRHDVPFDINLLRYLEYDAKKPEESVKLLARMIKGSLANVRDENKTDSPAFQVLPHLSEPKKSSLQAVPAAFAQHIKEVFRAKLAGDLSLFFKEIKGALWEDGGQRLLAEQLFDLNEHRLAMPVWERVLKLGGNELEARDRLSTIYQRLDMLDQSKEMLDILLDMKELSSERKAEALGLRGRNEKERWIEAWRSVPKSKRHETALESSHLRQSFTHYRDAFRVELKNYWTGQNALTMAIVEIELIGKALRKQGKNSPKRSASEIKALEEEKSRLALLVDASLKSAEFRAEPDDKWVKISRADLYLLIGDDPKETKRLYHEARQVDVNFVFAAARRQVQMLADLGIRSPHTKVALEELQPEKPGTETHVLLFTGHMIDAKNRKIPRFPAKKEPVAREAIHRFVTQEIDRVEAGLKEGESVEFLGITGGACGGDLLFHEVCEELGITTRMYLPFNRKAFFKTSVEFAGSKWANRFKKAYDRLKEAGRVYQLQETEELPGWLNHKQGYTVWTRNNQWMLHHAFAEGGSRVSLIALWDGEGEDGKGGTKDMYDEAGALGAHTILINTKEIFELTA